MSKEEFDNWLSDTVTMVHQQGYRVIPVYEKSPAKYRQGQTYLEMHHYTNAVSIGVVLDNCVLLDFDGNKADEAGEEIIDLETLAATLGLEEMPECVQEGSNGRSLHFLFSRGDRDVRMASKDGWLPHVDVKTKNQLMILKHGKHITDFELPRVEELPPCPEVLLEALSGRPRDLAAVPDGDDVARAEEDLKAGRNLHHSALTIANSLIFEGKTADEIEQHFEGLREDILQRDSQRVERFFGGELRDIIESGLDKYRDRVPSVGFEVIGEPARVAPTDVDWSDYVFVQQENRVMRLSTGGISTVPAFNAAMQGANTRVPTANGKTKQVSALTYLMDYKKVPPVFYRMYMPSIGKFFEHGGEPCVNSYQPELVPEADEGWMFSPAWRAIEEHYMGLFDDPADGKLILDWMAHNVQFPGRKILWAPIVFGVQGDGKSSIRNILSSVMGHKNVRDVNHGELSSQFNAYAEGACVAALEELKVAGHNRYEILNSLKPLVTNEIISVTRKGQDSIQVPNTQNYIGFTNEKDALPLTEDDRRYGVFRTKYQSREQMWGDTGTEYWDRFHSAYRDHPGAVRGWLLDRDVSDFDRHFPPAMNESKRRMIADARPQEDQAVIEVIDELGDFFTAEEVVDAARKKGFFINSHRVGKVAREIKYCKEQLMIDGERSHYWFSEKIAKEGKNQTELRNLARSVRMKRAAGGFSDNSA
jgi:hypothetical protein